MEASSGRYLTEAPVGRYHKASSGRLCQVAPIGHLHGASNGRFNIKPPSGRFLGRAASGHVGEGCGFKPWGLCFLQLERLIFSPGLSSLEPFTGRFPNGSDQPSKFCPVRGQLWDGSQATKFWTTNGCPEG
ncbi:hypothetical protein PCANC_14232 [Puccinia coronata f. sp. avenae]|uniref:Uncharacterized protein n=1 Tax=Puccinia coronata f. sp. avenae TaxID=200324 RepID=A0A2N5UQ96_9BASI|nr:hypothetical protein PCANC_14232 [Puccinia coronata f. sp. avenae]